MAMVPWYPGNPRTQCGGARIQQPGGAVDVGGAVGGAQAEQWAEKWAERRAERGGAALLSCGVMLLGENLETAEWRACGREARVFSGPSSLT